MNRLIELNRTLFGQVHDPSLACPANRATLPWITASDAELSIFTKPVTDYAYYKRGLSMANDPKHAAWVTYVTNNDPISSRDWAYCMLRKGHKTAALFNLGLADGLLVSHGVNPTKLFEGL